MSELASSSAAGRRNGALDQRFFESSVHDVARDLIGCRLEFDGAAGVIVETEAYDASDPACHAFGGRTPRNEVLFGPPGRAYVYLSYGIHACLNAVAEPDGSAAAALIRALEPVSGIEKMRRRRGMTEPLELCSGPGKLTEALGIGLEMNGASLYREPFAIHPRGGRWREVEVAVTTRVGITKAPELPWRYCATGNIFVSRPRPPVAM
jgi:DNA-3-methyladenine glycosylase